MPPRSNQTIAFTHPDLHLYVNAAHIAITVRGHFQVPGAGFDLFFVFVCFATGYIDGEWLGYLLTVCLYIIAFSINLRVFGCY